MLLATRLYDWGRRRNGRNVLYPHPQSCTQQVRVQARKIEERPGQTRPDQAQSQSLSLRMCD
jgi:hypothetical protein